MRSFFLFFFVFKFSFSQVGGGSAFEFLNLQTSPRINALAGYGPNVIDQDPNLGLYNPALINSKMNSSFVLNYTNYHADINYGSILFASNFKKIKNPILMSFTYLDYGYFDETNEFGDILGGFSASDYLFSVASSKRIFSIDSLSYFNLGVNFKSAYSQLYYENSFAVLFDLSILYHNEKKRLTSSILIRNLGYHLIPYSSGNREELPFEISLSITNKLMHMPLRWTFSLQHLEKLDLTFNNFSQTNNSINDSNQVGLGQKILRHCVLSGEFLISKNFNLRFGYNNRNRSELMILERKSMVGFSCGFSFKINRFKFNYSRQFHHYSNPINSFGITTNISAF